MVNGDLLHAEVSGCVTCWGLETESRGVNHGHDCHRGVAIGLLSTANATIVLSFDVNVITHFEVLGISSSRLDLRHHPLVFLADIFLVTVLAFLH